MTEASNPMEGAAQPNGDETAKADAAPNDEATNGHGEANGDETGEVAARNDEATNNHDEAKAKTSWSLGLSTSWKGFSSKPSNKTSWPFTNSSYEMLSSTSASAASYAGTSASVAAMYAAKQAVAAASAAEHAISTGAKSIQVALEEREQDQRRKAAQDEELRRGEVAPAEPPSAAATESLTRLHGLAKSSVDDPAYESMLRELWQATGGAPFERRGQGWIKRGFSTPDPDDDIRGGGLLALTALSYLADRYPVKTESMLDSRLFGTAGVLVCRELGRMCDIGSPLGLFPQRRPFWGALEDVTGFYEIFAVGLAVVHREWLSSGTPEGARDHARLAAAVRAASKEVETLLAQAPASLDELSLLAKTVPGSPQHDKMAQLAELANLNGGTGLLEDDEDDDDDDTQQEPSAPSPERSSMGNEQDAT